MEKLVSRISQVVNDSTRATCFQEVVTKIGWGDRGQGEREREGGSLWARIGLRPGVASWNRFLSAAASRCRSQSLGNLHAHFLSGSCCCCSAAPPPPLPHPAPLPASPAPHLVSCNFKFFVVSFWYLISCNYVLAANESSESRNWKYFCLPQPACTCHKLLQACPPPSLACLSSLILCKLQKIKTKLVDNFVWFALPFGLFFFLCFFFSSKIAHIFLKNFSAMRKTWKRKLLSFNCGCCWSFSHFNCQINNNYARYEALLPMMMAANRRDLPQLCQLRSRAPSLRLFLSLCFYLTHLSLSPSRIAVPCSASGCLASILFSISKLKLTKGNMLQTPRKKRGRERAS